MTTDRLVVTIGLDGADGEEGQSSGGNSLSRSDPPAPAPLPGPLAMAMLMSLISLVPPPAGGGALTPAVVTDLLWPHATPADAVQHLHACVGTGRIEVAVFTLAVDQAVADITAYVVCLRAVERIPVLRRWRVVPLSR
ncbi:hypothetical protein [Micromonospora sp. NPDC023737]|uniref:hypothetical protein n=1 Tax=unclassified Micromonospora TaxID=2617518 RepID=UPI0034060520